MNALQSNPDTFGTVGSVSVLILVVIEVSYIILGCPDYTICTLLHLLSVHKLPTPYFVCINKKCCSIPTCDMVTFLCRQ